MNEFQEDILRKDLEVAIGRRYSKWFKEQKAAGAEVETNVVFTPKKDGKHKALVSFSVGQDCLNAMYEYVPSKPLNPAHWYMASDWND